MSLIDDLKERERIGRLSQDFPSRIQHGNEIILSSATLFRAPSYQSHQGTEIARVDVLQSRAAKEHSTRGRSALASDSIEGRGRATV